MKNNGKGVRSLRLITLAGFVAFVTLLFSTAGYGRSLLLPSRKQQLAYLRSIKTFLLDRSSIHKDDMQGRILGDFLAGSIHQVLGWQMAPEGVKPDIIVAIAPDGGEYTDLANLSTHCSSALGDVNCKSSDGSTLTVQCSGGDCDSNSTPPTASYEVFMTAPPVNGMSQVVWTSEEGPPFQLMDDGRWLSTLCRDSQAGSNKACKQKAKQVIEGDIVYFRKYRLTGK